MKKFSVALFIVMFCVGSAYAGIKITLNTNEQLSVPTAVAMEWEQVNIDINRKTVTIVYHWLDAGENVILVAGKRNPDYRWYCIDRPEVLADPPIDNTVVAPAQTCFSDTFGFSIRAQDEGTTLGTGLRTLLWNKMKADLLTGGNDGTFE